jgi:hypothetical protein
MCVSVACEGWVREPVLSGLYDYWSGKRRPDRLPGRAAIAPEEMVPALPHLMLVDVLDEVAGAGRLLRYRLVGTVIAAGVDPTGRTLQDVLPGGAYREHVLELYDAVLARAEPLYTRHRYPAADGTGAREVARLFLPLAADGSRVDMILVGQIRHAPRIVRTSMWQEKPGQFEELERRFLS